MLFTGVPILSFHPTCLESLFWLAGWLAGGLGWAGLGWAELSWAGLGWAGLGWAGWAPACPEGLWEFPEKGPLIRTMNPY